MRSLKSGLIAITLSGLFGTLAVVGCSASGDDGGIGTEATPTEPGNSSGGAVLPPKDDEPEEEETDSGKKTDSGKTDAGKKDATVDAGPPPPVEGAACPTLNAIGTKKCGACGTAETVCLEEGTTGKGKWSSYGSCNGELAGGCVPGTVVNEDCGNCGKVQKTCTQYCAYTSGTCTGQPANSCKPGLIEYSTAGCATGYRNRTCGAACTFGSYSATCEEPNNPNKMTIATTVGGLVTQQWTLSAAKVGKKVTGTCGSSASASSAADLPYEVVEVKNPAATAATVQIYHSGTGTPLDTLIWVYKKTLPPTTDAQYAACDFGSADSCISGDPCGNSANGGSSLDWAGVDNVVIPAGGKILVYSSAYSSGEVGNFNLNIKTKSL